MKRKFLAPLLAITVMSVSGNMVAFAAEMPTTEIEYISETE